ncbi:uncharacterized protein METZ01_LOCUS442997, partial [marine metagenome]
MAVKRHRGRSNCVSTNRPEIVHFVSMPLPRSGAPSPGQPTQVGACENLGRLLWVESVCACSEKPDATSPNKTANKENITVSIFIAL